VGLEIIGELAFNSEGISVSPTAASLFRECDRNSSTQIFDELEDLRNPKSENSGAIAQILNAGFKRGGFVRRVMDAKEDTLRNFNVFSPKAFGSINRLPDTTAHRSFRIVLARKMPTDRLPRFDAQRLKPGISVELRDVVGVLKG
jgi:hypothetical protein